MQKVDGKYSSIILFIASLLGCTATFPVLNVYIPIVFFAVALFLIFIVGLPWGGWFRGINKPILFGSQLAVVIVISMVVWRMAN